MPVPLLAPFVYGIYGVESVIACTVQMLHLPRLDWA